MRTRVLSIIGLVCVAGCATPRTPAPASAATAREAVARYAAADLGGTWQLTLPAGFKSDVTLTALGEDEVRRGAKGNLAGRYRIDGDALTIVELRDQRMSSLRWQVKSPREIVLVDGPSASSAGSKYVGASLTR